VRNLIRENKLHQVYGMMQVGQNKTGMVTLNQSLLNLILKRKIDIKNAFEESADVEELDSMLKKAGI
jgi:twitching motility protein PilT